MPASWLLLSWSDASIILRYRSPEMERGYRAPLVPVLPVIGIIGSFVLIVSLGPDTWIRFVGWLGLGLASTSSTVGITAYGRGEGGVGADTSGPAASDVESGEEDTTDRREP